MASVFDYIFNIGGNFTAQISGMSAAAGNFTAQAEVAESRGRSLAGTLASFSYIKDIAQNVADGFSQLSSAGVTLDSQMHDLSAVAGVTGDGLKQIETFARQSAKAFGTDAAVAVEGYKLLLSQLTPELGKYPEALSAMGDCIQTTSKLMGGDGVAAAQVLTTAMNQYGVSLEDPTAAAGEMARMMNVMAAAGQAGSAELPAISAALQQCGMAAKAANVSFEETNAAIQVLDKAGKKASEGGVALRNVLGQMSKGRFIEKQAAEELAAAGIDVAALADNTKSLQERLEMLKPLLNDSALLSKFFGVENANAARALIQGTEQLQEFTSAVTGTNSATEQALVVFGNEKRNNYDNHRYIPTLKDDIVSFRNFGLPKAEGEWRFGRIALPKVGLHIGMPEFSIQLDSSIGSLGYEDMTLELNGIDDKSTTCLSLAGQRYRDRMVDTVNHSKKEIERIANNKRREIIDVRRELERYLIDMLR